MTVDVPKTATVKVDDSSGDMRVSDVRGAQITDSSGDQTVERIAGDLDVADSSGEIRISESPAVCACATAPATWT